MYIYIAVGSPADLSNVLLFSVSAFTPGLVLVTCHNMAVIC